MRLETRLGHRKLIIISVSLFKDASQREVTTVDVQLQLYEGATSKMNIR